MAAGVLALTGVGMAKLVSNWLASVVALLALPQLFCAQYVSTPAALLAVPAAGIPREDISAAAPPLACSTLPKIAPAVLAKDAVAVALPGVFAADGVAAAGAEACVGCVTQPDKATAALAAAHRKIRCNFILPSMPC